MTANGWKEVILHAAIDPIQLNLLSSLLEELDQAKQLLRDRGYGVTGQGILETVELVPNLTEVVA